MILLITPLFILRHHSLWFAWLSLISACFFYPSAFADSISQPPTIRLSQGEKIIDKNDCAVKTLRHAYSNIGYHLGFTILPSQRALNESNTGRTDGETARIAGLDQLYTNLVRIPVAICHMRLELYVRSGIQIQDLNSLKTLAFAIRRGTLASEREFDQYTPTKVNSDALMIDMLLRQRLDAIALAQDRATALANAIQQGQVYKHDIDLPPIKMYHYLHKNHQVLIPKITEELQRLEKNGFIAEAIRNHVGSSK